ncbi:MAG: hypothetical protein Q9157_005885 [Trypethelium eluteriae]
MGKENISMVTAQSRPIFGILGDHQDEVEDKSPIPKEAGLDLPIPTDQSTVTIRTFDGTNEEEPELQRKPSVRQRMLSKVRGGLSVKSRSNLNIRSEPCPREGDLETSREQSKDMRTASLSSVDTCIDRLEKILRSSSLSKSCQLAYQIALALDVPGDKLSIYYTTRFAGAALPFRRDYLLYPFEDPNLQIVQDRLLAMQRTTSKTSTGTRADSRGVQRAFQKIISNFLNIATEHGSLSPRHAFFLSPESLESLQQNARPAEMIYHHISPWNDNLRIGPTEEPPELIFAKLQQHTFNRETIQPCTDLQNIIRFARMHDGFGQLQNLTVQLEERGDCEIKTTIGPLAHHLLGAGQLFSILAQVKVPRLAALQSARTEKCSGRDEQAWALRNSDHLIADLEEFLGETTTELFTAHVGYRHSLFPADSEICIRKTCRVRRSVAESDWSLPLSYIQGRPSQFMSQDCTDSTNLPLRFQHCQKTPDGNPNDRRPETTSPERVTIGNSGTGSETRNILSNSPMEEDEPSRRTPVETYMYKQDSLNTISTDTSQFGQNEDPHDLHSMKSMKSMRYSSESPNGSPIRTSPDKARKIWQHMRKASKSGRRNDRDSCESINSLGSNEVELCRIRRMALKNKRSLGTSTLWSLRQEIAGLQN